MPKKRRYIYKEVRSGRSKKKQKASFRIILYTVICILVVFGMYIMCKKFMNIVYRSNIMIIKDIAITGSKNITKTEIRELIPFNIGDNILKINLSQAEKEIKSLKPELKNIVMRRAWHKVKIKLYERTSEAFVENNGELLGIDFDDITFPLRGFMREDKVPRINYKTDKERKQLLVFVKRLKNTGVGFLSDILEINMSSTGDIVFVLNSNTIVFWGDDVSEQLCDKFKKFQKIYVDAIAKYKNIEYIDLTLYSLGRVIVKPV